MSKIFPRRKVESIVQVIFRYVSGLFMLSFVLVRTSAAGVPAAPQNIVTRVADKCVILHWDAVPDPGVVGYFVCRQSNDTGSYVALNGSAIAMTGFADVNVQDSVAYSYFVKSVNSSNQSSDSSMHVIAIPHQLTDDEFLDFLQQTAIDFFWYEANPTNGLIKDRSTTNSPCSIASVGFGLTAICIGMDHGWIQATAGRDRVLTTLKTLYYLPQGSGLYGYAGYKGFFYHFLDMSSGLRTGSSELSSIDTALLLAGILYAKQYFLPFSDNISHEICLYADSIYDRVDWKWMQAPYNGIYMQWTPEHQFNNIGTWTGYCEAMIMNTLAAGSPTHPANGQYLYLSWVSNYSWQTLYGYSYVVFPPLFGHQYSQCWIDYRNISDPYMSKKGITYFENSRRATLADRAYCAANPGGFAAYSDSIWGLTASDDPGGYLAHGAPPPQNDNGTLAPTAAGGSIAFTPNESLAALRAIYSTYRTQLVTPYGLGDAFNPTKSWFDNQNIGIDEGPIAIMIENYSTQKVWSLFMQNQNVQNGLRALYFSPVTEVRQPTPRSPLKFSLGQNYPNPFNPTTVIEFEVPSSGFVSLKVYDVLGREVRTLVNEVKKLGRYEVRLDASGLPSGVYFAVLRVDGQLAVRKITVLK